MRTWGWLFNPISVYYCFEADGTTVEQTVVEVTNTPWHERTAYVLPGAGTHVVDKALHVSPFLPMDLRHRFIIGEPGPRLMLGVDDLRGDDWCSQPRWPRTVGPPTGGHWAGSCGASP